MRQPIPTIKTTVARANLAAMDAAGLSAEAVLADAGLTRQQVEDRDGRIPMTKYMRLLDLMAAAANDPYFGVTVGLAWSLQDFGVLGYVMNHSPTVNDAFRSLGRYWRLEMDGAEVNLVTDGDMAQITYRIYGVSSEEAARESEAAAAYAINIMRQLYDPNWRPAEVHLQNVTTPDQAKLEHLYGAPVYLGQASNAVCGLASDFVAPLRSADPNLLAILTDHANQQLADMPAADDLVGDVRRHIADGMRKGRPTIEYVASQMAVSRRTLQRRLSEEAVTFADLVDEFRQELSNRYFREPKLAVTEIAFLLGYSEVSAFNRACRRWTGKSPTEFRRSLATAGTA